MSELTNASRRWVVACSLLSVVAAPRAGADFSFPDFTNASALVLVGQATTVGGVLRVLPGQSFAKGAAWFVQPQALADGFETWFDFRLSGGSGSGDGFAFVVQNEGPSALGLYGLGLGYSSGPEFQLCQDLDGIVQSVAVEFDTFYNSWAADLPVPHISVQTRGAAPNCAHHGSSIGSTTAIPNVLVGDHTARIHYAAGLLSIFVDDLPVLQVSVDLAASPNLANGWVGFTSGSGSVYRDTDILSWTFTGSPSTCQTPSVYCSAKPNSLGCVPQIGFTGTPSISAAEEFVVTATDVCNYRSGLMVWSRASAAQPFQGGFLCVGPPLNRTPLQDSGGNLGVEDCSGRFAFALSPAYLATSNVGIGHQLFAQYWSRDPYSVPYPVSLTNALGLTICP